MRNQLLLVFVAVFWFSHVSHGAQRATTSDAYVGVVSSVSAGSLYIGGVSHSIATVDTDRGPKRVAVPTMGVMQPLQIGESLSFSGPTVTVNSEPVINTREGFIFRAAEQSMAAYMAGMMGQAQATAAKAALSGIPDAVPTMIMESPQQAAEGAAKRRTDLLLTLLSLIVGLLAFERIQRLTVTPVRWIKGRFSKRATTTEEAAARQPAAPDSRVTPSVRG